MNRRLAVLLSVMALGVVVAGCGSSDKSSSSSSSSSSGGSGGGKAAPAPKKSAKKAGGQVTMKNISFSPASVTIKAGQTVTWTNEDQVGHDVTGRGGPGGNFKSGAAGGLQNGDTYSHKFTKPGTIQYVCTVHPNMKATIKVE